MRKMKINKLRIGGILKFRRGREYDVVQKAM